MDSTGLTKKVGILLYAGVEPMDFVGPYEVFSAVNFDAPYAPYDVFTVSESKGDVNASFGLVVKAEYGFTDCPQADIIVIPGGNVTPELLGNPNLINWIQAQSKNAEITLSVCSGAILIAKAGLLAGLPAVTHHMCYESLLAIEPTITLNKSDRFVDNGSVITAAGVSAGIDAALHIVYKVSGKEAFFKACEFMEYGDAWKSVQRRLAGLPVARKINDKCIKCGKCAEICPYNAVFASETQYEINPEKCVGIGPCAGLCPVGAIESSF
ncbi:DJ-1/PfpI family protein [Sporomusa sp.]|uniref:DJ-1/PfpI family protein n=1 Tax=Sporomusa sp. TaxID=2078658 RepID=UPI002BBAEA37|nr:DJ-1/PfpI family protein [Sporomusa sp.]HWR42896.1 DJ-1/PfpI family protein [Sporomusa sp.]